MAGPWKVLLLHEGGTVRCSRPPDAITAGIRAAALSAAALLGGCGAGDTLAHPGDQPTVITEADRPVGHASTIFRARKVMVEDVVISVPLDATTRGPGRCEAPVELGSQVRLGLRWSDARGQAARLVGATFDEEGAPRSYNDLRGGATYMHTVDSIPGTFITLMFEGELALVQNRGPEPRDAFVLPFDEALEARELDVPRRWIEDLRDRCAGDALSAGR